MNFKIISSSFVKDVNGSDILSKWNRKQAEVAILISDKIIRNKKFT
jgi:hypothetical protein